MTDPGAVRVTHDVVEFFSRVRLPLQPKDQCWQDRESLRTALRCMQAPDGKILEARYTSSDDSFCDIENVLVYNVGSGSFASSARNGLRFLRQRHSNDQALPDGCQHHHRYAFVEAGRGSEDVAARFEFSLPRVDYSLKAASVWWNASRAESTATMRSIAGRFAIHIELEVPSSGLNVAAFVKPLVDGIVAALHVNSAPDDRVVERLALAWQWERAAVEERLRFPRIPVLGERQNVVAYRNFVKWDPADHLCEDCTVLVTRSPSNRCSVSVAPIQERRGSFGG